MATTIPMPHLTRDRFARLTAYLGLVEELNRQRAEFVTLSQLATVASAPTGTVVDDLAALRNGGDVTFDLDLGDLRRDLRDTLGRDNPRDVFLAGTTPLARSILACGLAGEHGLNIVTVFDDDPHLVGTELAGRQVLPYSKLVPLAERMNVRLGIIAVDDYQAQNVADLMVVGGIEALVCCGEGPVEVSGSVAVARFQLAASMRQLVAGLQ
jgi:redox-sensing transcriptional repressor